MNLVKRSSKGYPCYKTGNIWKRKRSRLYVHLKTMQPNATRATDNGIASMRKNPENLPNRERWREGEAEKPNEASIESQRNMGNKFNCKWAKRFVSFLPE